MQYVEIFELLPVVAQNMEFLIFSINKTQIIEVSLVKNYFDAAIFI